MLTFHVDFNDQTEDDRVVALLRLASGGRQNPRTGDLVALRDSEGNRCQGQVERIEGALAYVIPDWATWSPAEDLLRALTIGFKDDAVTLDGATPAAPGAFGRTIGTTTR